MCEPFASCIRVFQSLLRTSRQYHRWQCSRQWLQLRQWGDVLVQSKPWVCSWNQHQAKVPSWRYLGRPRTVLLSLVQCLVIFMILCGDIRCSLALCPPIYPKYTWIGRTKGSVAYDDCGDVFITHMEGTTTRICQGDGTWSAATCLHSLEHGITCIHSNLSVFIYIDVLTNLQCC